MGWPAKKGGSGERLDLEAHLKALKDAALAWLAYVEAKHGYAEDPDTHPKPEEAAEQPEALRLMYMCRNNGVLWWAGGLADQPFLLMAEWGVCEEAEREYQAFKDRMERKLEKLKKRKA